MPLTLRMNNRKRGMGNTHTRAVEDHTVVLRVGNFQVVERSMCRGTF